MSSAFVPGQIVFSNPATPLGWLTFYLAGTTTPQAAYSDATGATPLANPLQLDANGQAAFYLRSDLVYKINLQDASLVQQAHWPQDNIPGGVSAANLPYLAPYTGAGATTQNIHNLNCISIFDFMTTAQYAAWNAAQTTYDMSVIVQTAITAASANKFNLWFPAGTYFFNGVSLSALQPLSNVTLCLANGATFLRATTSTGSALFFTSATLSNFNIYGGTLQGQGGTMTCFETVTGTMPGCQFIGVNFVNWLDPNGGALYCSNPSKLWVLDCTFTTISNGVIATGNSSDLFFSKNSFNTWSKNCIRVQATSTDACNRAVITENICVASNGNQSAIYVTHGTLVMYDIVISNNICIGQGTPFEAGGNADLISTFGILYLTCTGNVCRDGGDLGIAIQNVSRGTVTGNTCFNNDKNGITVQDSHYVSATGNTCLNNGHDANNVMNKVSFPPSGILVYASGLGGLTCDNIMVSGNNCSNIDPTTYPYQHYGVSVIGAPANLRKVLIGPNEGEYNIWGMYYTSDTTQATTVFNDVLGGNSTTQHNSHLPVTMKYAYPYSATQPTGMDQTVANAVTTTTAGVAPGVGVIPATSVAGMAIGDYIGITLSTKAIEWHTISNIVSLNITLNSVMVGTVSSGAIVKTNRWNGCGNYLATAMPSTGSWTQGMIVWNASAVAAQPIGWMRLTTGNANVLNTDWKAMANL